MYMVTRAVCWHIHAGDAGPGDQTGHERSCRCVASGYAGTLRQKTSHACRPGQWHDQWPLPSRTAVGVLERMTWRCPRWFQHHHDSTNRFFARSLPRIGPGHRTGFCLVAPWRFPGTPGARRFFARQSPLGERRTFRRHPMAIAHIDNRDREWMSAMRRKLPDAASSWRRGLATLNWGGGTVGVLASLSSRGDGGCTVPVPAMPVAGGA